MLPLNMGLAHAFHLVRHWCDLEKLERLSSILSGTDFYISVIVDMAIATFENNETLSIKRYYLCLCETPI